MTANGGASSAANATASTAPSLPLSPVVKQVHAIESLPLPSCGNRRACQPPIIPSSLPVALRLPLAQWQASGPACELAARKDAVERIAVAFEQKATTLRLNHLALTSLPPCLDQLNRVTELNVSCNALTALPALPGRLRKLWAGDNQLAALPPLPVSMKLLMAQHNCLTDLQDFPAGLTIVQVKGNQLKQLPQLPATLRMLDVAHNHLTALPDNFNSVMQAGYLDVSHNPLSKATMERLAMLPYSIDVVCLHNPWFISSEKWSISSAAEHWQELGTSPLNNLAAGWDEMEDEPHAAAFARFLNRLKQTAEYEAPHLQPALVERVSALLTAVRQSPPLRQLCFAIASDSVKACADLVAMALNDMETARLVHEAETGGSATADLHALGRGMFRLYLIDDIVVRNLQQWSMTYGHTDQVEVRLGYQTKLADRLNLPGVARDMKYPLSTMLAREDLAAAETEIRARERSSERTAFLADWAPWRKAMQQRHPAPFAQLQSSIEAARERLVVKPDALSEQEWITAFKDLRREEASQLHTLTVKLTRQWQGCAQADGLPASGNTSISAI